MGQQRRRRGPAHRCPAGEAAAAPAAAAAAAVIPAAVSLGGGGDCSCHAGLLPGLAQPGKGILFARSNLYCGQVAGATLGAALKIVLLLVLRRRQDDGVLVHADVLERRAALPQLGQLALGGRGAGGVARRQERRRGGSGGGERVAADEDFNTEFHARAA